MSFVTLHREVGQSRVTILILVVLNNTISSVRSRTGALRVSLYDLHREVWQFRVTILIRSPLCNYIVETNTIGTVRSRLGALRVFLHVITS